MLETVTPETEPYEAARLRQASLQDVGALVTLYARAREHSAETPATMREWLEHGGALLLENRSGEVICALRWREDGVGWHLDRVATLPEARSQGYGRWLMTKVEALAIRTNIPTLSLTLDTVRDDLTNYYRRMGYRVTEQTARAVTLEKRVGGMWQYQR